MWGCFVLLIVFIVVFPHAVEFDQFGIANAPSNVSRFVVLVLFVGALACSLFLEVVAALYVVPTQFICMESRLSGLF